MKCKNGHDAAEPHVLGLVNSMFNVPGGLTDHLKFVEPPQCCLNLYTDGWWAFYEHRNIVREMIARWKQGAT